MPSKLFNLVVHLFDGFKENVNGIHIRMQDNTITDIDLFEKGGDVYIKMNGVEMGRFSPYSKQGYTACFFQSPQKVLKYATDDQLRMIKGICDGNSILYM